MQWDVIVVGAGAAGLMAAMRASELGQRVLLLEKNRRPGTKILMSGGTRCNITHATDQRGMIEAFGDQGRFLHSAIAALPPADLVELIEAEGVSTKVEPGGKVFPVSDRAIDVLRALTSRLQRSGAELALEEPLVRLTREVSGGFCLETKQRTLRCRAVIVTTGGQSYPGCGTTGDAYEWMRSLGHTIVPPRAALTPVTSDANWVQGLTGVTIPNVRVRVVESNDGPPGTKKVLLAERSGSFLFTHFGMSGPVVMDISRAITAHGDPHALALVCDFVPDIQLDALRSDLRSRMQQAGRRQVLGVVSEFVPRRLAESILHESGISPEQRAAEFSKPNLQRILAAMKQSIIPVSGTRGFKKAEVTAGGVSRAEVDSHTMQSRIVPGLFIAGELLDVDGPIGGYNFQAAFSTAWLAATHAAHLLAE